MQKYFFHIDYGQPSPDIEGSLLPDLKSAQKAAVVLLGRILMDEGDVFWDKPNVVITVEDAGGEVLWTLETVGMASAAVGRVKEA